MTDMLVSVAPRQVADHLAVGPDHIAVAELINSGMSHFAVAASLDITERQVRRYNERFHKFAAIIGLDVADASRVLRGDIGEDFHTVDDVYKHRLKQMEKSIKEYRKREVNRQAVITSIVDGIVGEMGVLEPTPFAFPPEPAKEEGHDQYAILECGDWQLGSAWKAFDTHAGAMSTGEILKRIETLTERTIRLVNLQRHKVNIPTLVVNLLGDIIEGESIYPGQRGQIDLSAYGQFVVCVGHMEKMLRTFLQHFEEVLVYAVPGNHGRMGRKDEGNDPHDNWDMLCYNYVMERFKDEPRIKWNISLLNLCVYVLPHAPKWVHAILHGNEIRSYDGFPSATSLVKKTDRIGDVTQLPIHFAHMGHFHVGVTLDKSFGTRIVNGPLTGESPLATRNFLSTRPHQKLFGLHPEYGLTFSYPVYVTDPPEMREQDVGVHTHHFTSMEQLQGMYEGHLGIDGDDM